MDELLSIRPATPADQEFLVEAICEAEKGGTNCLSFCNVFDMSEPEFKRALAGMLDEDIQGQELCISDFLVAELDGQPVGACCAWVEGATGVSSAILKASILMHGIDGARMRAAQRHFRLLEQLYIARDQGAIQIESVYVRGAGRGRRIAARLIAAQMTRLRGAATADHAQVILTSSNSRAGSVYASCGFSTLKERSSNDPSILDLVPSAGKIMMQRLITGVGI